MTHNVKLPPAQIPPRALHPTESDRRTTGFSVKSPIIPNPSPKHTASSIEHHELAVCLRVPNSPTVPAHTSTFTRPGKVFCPSPWKILPTPEDPNHLPGGKIAPTTRPVQNPRTHTRTRALTSRRLIDLSVGAAGNECAGAGASSSPIGTSGLCVSRSKRADALIASSPGELSRREIKGLREMGVGAILWWEKVSRVRCCGEAPVIFGTRLVRPAEEWVIICRALFGA